jgi:hypothetical protein
MSDKSNIIFKDHAIIRMLQRSISKNDVLETINGGEIIEEYKDDYPYESCLMFKIVSGRPIHVVVANNSGENQKIVVTVYIPDFTNFEADFKTRKRN